ncbi:UDP-3-O-(3-hydroxymyristoyl)glucosamine N-acyltransferase [Alloprevotella sp. Lung230]|uniref:UDP-3-O-(3-hydroxymyristoyl)glucosamine N-acyltransferase n=1 Tax=Alloprevotella sp. Lung230 TaxID=2766595 RepID=UPI0016556BB9|nr:UDP-3-O-(3-hydroxymyristoyl)glucosamine N-acyltransferase [Alloprevotella sp. Lung230]MBC8625396.1 UDP-3-O-(3-hydroxymyristoyl)glucosamine N-acyltransferase [Alloprevotella sp. Lung230]
MEFNAQQIASYLGGIVEGNPEAAVKTFAKIEEGQEGAISFLANPKYAHYLYETLSSVVLVNQDFVPERPVKATLVRVPNAYEAIARLLSLYESMTQKRTGIHPLACVSETATLGEGVYVGPFAYVGEGVSIGNGTQIYAHVVLEENTTVGDNCTIYPNVSVYKECRIGNGVILHSGCVIGADGFGFAPAADGYEKIPQIGIVTIEDNVEIGANACVDRSTMGSTYVRQGVKIDNLVQIAHNVEVGAHTVMSAQVGVAGSTKIGEWCMFAGQVGMAGHLNLPDRTTAGAQAGIHTSRTGGVPLMGTPAIDARTFARSSAVFKNLPDLREEVRNLRKEIEQLKAQLGQ